MSDTLPTSDELTAALHAVVVAQAAYVDAGAQSDAVNAAFADAKAKLAAAGDILAQARVAKDAAIDSAEKLLEALR